MTTKTKGRDRGNGAAPKTFDSGKHSPLLSTTQAIDAEQRSQALRQITDTLPGNGVYSQRQRIMDALRLFGAVSTVECARYLDIIHPPRRVMELRERGAAIVTHWRTEYTEFGKPHRVGLYVLEVRG